LFYFELLVICRIKRLIDPTFFVFRPLRSERCRD